LLWDPRKRNDAAATRTAAAVADDGQTFPTKALRKFVGSLTQREAPVLLDLGPVVGSNVSFFGERLGCKILIEDLFADLERHARNGTTPFAEVLGGRLKHEAGSVDGILCWNLFDYLDTTACQVLGRTLTRLLKPDGSLLAFFCTIASPDSKFVKYMIVDEDRLKQKPYSAVGRKQTSLQNRDVIRIFDGLKVAESFLLKTNVREFLFRKPATH